MFMMDLLVSMRAGQEAFKMQFASLYILFISLSLHTSTHFSYLLRKYERERI